WAASAAIWELPAIIHLARRYNDAPTGSEIQQFYKDSPKNGAVTLSPANILNDRKPEKRVYFVTALPRIVPSTRQMHWHGIINIQDRGQDSIGCPMMQRGLARMLNGDSGFI
ncbi:MAG: hypothetical protein WA874_21210, partial [Chryseosolibacter sp.]